MTRTLFSGGTNLGWASWTRTA